MILEKPIHAMGIYARTAVQIVTVLIGYPKAAAAATGYIRGSAGTKPAGCLRFNMYMMIAAQIQFVAGITLVHASAAEIHAAQKIPHYASLKKWCSRR